MAGWSGWQIFQLIRIRNLSNYLVENRLFPTPVIFLCIYEKLNNGAGLENAAEFRLYVNDLANAGFKDPDIVGGHFIPSFDAHHGLTMFDLVLWELRVTSV